MRKILYVEDLYAFISELIDLAKEKKDFSTVEILESGIQSSNVTSERLINLEVALKEISTEPKKEYMDPYLYEIGFAIQSINKAIKRANNPLFYDLFHFFFNRRE